MKPTTKQNLDKLITGLRLSLNTCIELDPGMAGLYKNAMQRKILKELKKDQLEYVLKEMEGDLK